MKKNKSLDKKCMQYYYSNEQDAEKYKINCEEINYDINNLKEFNNKDFLDFVNKKYGNEVFNGDSPFVFNDFYKQETNEDICNIEEYSLKPQQKFMGQFINPLTNFKDTLIYHGLGSGKTCTSIVIGEAFKNTSKTKILFVVPAPLVDQVKDEILGQLKKINEREPEIWSCTSQCVINGERDFYTNVKQKIMLEFLEYKYDELVKELNEISKQMINLEEEQTEYDRLRKVFMEKENEKNKAFMSKNKFKEQLMSNITKVFEIESHNKFMNRLFMVAKDGTWTRKDILTNKNSPLLSSSGLIVIDEIQRLVSESGIFYNKLFTAIHHYMNKDARLVLMSATPVYDNPYELALTMNLLRLRLPFPVTKNKFYSFFLGKYRQIKYNEDDQEYKNEECVRVKEQNNFLTMDSCVINKDLLRAMCSGYVSYFKGGNPNAYPYKRIIVMEHKMPSTQKGEYIKALASDVAKDKSMYKNLLNPDEYIIRTVITDIDDAKTNDSDKVSGIYVRSQQLSNIALPVDTGELIENMHSKKTQLEIKNGLTKFRDELMSLKNRTPEVVLNYIRYKGYSEKFVKIIELSLKSNRPVFIFSNWLQFGVESLSIILDACGLIKYPYTKMTGKSDAKESEKIKYFIWNSETSVDKDLTNRVRKLYNSYENRNGSKLKIILGTRSIMEGVSFKNVGQVHITDPWWNEARIEQILARAVRFCSHSDLPLEEQYTDIYRHYSVLPMKPDPNVQEMLIETTASKSFKNLDTLSVEQKMVKSAIKKSQINNEFEEILKQVAYDCEINEKGNIIRLEENIMPLNNGNYQIYFKNVSLQINYLCNKIPNEVSYDDILNRKYSYPNLIVDENIEFTECEIGKENKLIEILAEQEPDKLTYEELGKDLTLYENIKCWKSEKTISQILDSEDLDDDISKYLKQMRDNFDLYLSYRKNILGEKQDKNKIYFKERNILGKQKLLKCLKNISESDSTPKRQKEKLKKLLSTVEKSDTLNKKIIDIVYKYKFLPENMIEKLMELEAKELNEILKEAQDYDKSKTK